MNDAIVMCVLVCVFMELYKVEKVNKLAARDMVTITGLKQSHHSGRPPFLFDLFILSVFTFDATIG